jgi:HAD superfamily hydrolase (TIGR01509 family)
MLRAVIFDCNGVIADDEPIHYLLFQGVLKEEGISLSREEYNDKYLSFDDRHCFEAVLRDRGQRADPARVAELVERKAGRYRATVPGRLMIFPGVRELVRSLAERFPLAVASGARREEIAYILNEAGIFPHFRAIVGAEDVHNAKPDPEPFLTALERLNAAGGDGEAPLEPSQCLVVEDSVGGVEGAKAAGMRCLAVANTYPARALAAADRVVSTLDGLGPEDLAALFPRA